MALTPFEFDHQQKATDAVMGGDAATTAVRPSAAFDPAQALASYRPPMQMPQSAIPATPDPLAQASSVPPAPARPATVGYNFQTKEVFAGGKVFPGDNGSVLEQAEIAGLFSVDNPQLPKGFDPVPASQLQARLARMREGRSFGDTVSEVGSGLVRGATATLPAMVNEAGAYFSPAGSDAEAFFERGAEYWNNSTEPADLLGRGATAKAFVQGAEALPATAAGMAATVVNPVVGGAAVATLFGATQAQQT